jgi:hypothetical protein
MSHIAALSKSMYHQSFSRRIGHDTCNEGMVRVIGETSDFSRACCPRCILPRPHLQHLMLWSSTRALSVFVMVCSLRTAAPLRPTMADGQNPRVNRHLQHETGPQHRTMAGQSGRERSPAGRAIGPQSIDECGPRPPLHWVALTPGLALTQSQMRASYRKLGRLAPPR